MRFEAIQSWLKESKRRQLLLLNLKVPMTSTQLKNLVKIERTNCSNVLYELKSCKLVRCLNENSLRNRVYGLTKMGAYFRKWLFQFHRYAYIEYEQPNIDWELYGWCGFRQRSVVIKSLMEPLNPADIKRKARSLYPSATMSANNVRDIIKLFLNHAIVEPVFKRKRYYPQYRLTETGKSFQYLFYRAETYLDLDESE